MDRSDRWLSLVLRTALLALCFWMVRGLLTPVALGSLVALLLYPAQRRLTPRLGRFAPAWITAGATLLIMVPLVLIGFEAVASVHGVVTRDWPGAIDGIQEVLNRHLSGFTRQSGGLAGEVRDHLVSLLRRAGAAVAGALGGAATALPGILLDAFLFILAIYYFLRDGRALSQWMARLSPFEPGETSALFESIHDTVNGAIAGLFVTAAVQGALTTAALLFFGVPGAFLLGILATLLSAVPMIGTTPVTVGSAIYVFATGRIGAGVGMAASAALIGLADNVVRPWVQSAQSRMHPLIALLSILGGLSLFGAAGLVIGPVVAAIAIWAMDTYGSSRMARQGTPSAEPH